MALQRAWLDLGASNLMLAFQRYSGARPFPVYRGKGDLHLPLKNIPLDNGSELQSADKDKLGCCLIPQERLCYLGQDRGGWQGY